MGDGTDSDQKWGAFDSTLEWKVGERGVESASVMRQERGWAATVEGGWY